jgi:hypothetical protein
LTIYDSMHDHLNGLLQSLLQVKDFHIQIPLAANSYIAHRRNALSNASVRAQDTVSTHLTWMQYHQQMTEQTPIVDMVAWELAYKELATTYSTTVEAIACLKMSMSPDPAKPYITVKGLKPMLVDDKTTPEYVALANRLAEALEWDLTELKPPLVALSLEDMSSFDDMVKHVFEGMGIDSTPPTFLEVVLDTQAGDDVTLA